MSVVSNVSTSGTPTVTTYNYQNVDPQAGLEWRDALQDFGRSTIIVNQTGVFGLYGGAATKISAKLDKLFANALFPPDGGAVTPSSAVAVIYNNKHFLNLMTVLDEDLGTTRTIMATWNEKDWTISSQSVTFTFIGTQKIGSTYKAFGTDGTSIYPMFQKPSSTLNKRLDTKFYGADKMFIQKELLATWMQFTDNSTGLAGVSGTLTIVASGLARQNENFPSVESVTATDVFFSPPTAVSAPAPYMPLWGSGVYSIKFSAIGMRFQSSSPDFTLGNWVLGYKDVTAYF